MYLVLVPLLTAGFAGEFAAGSGVHALFKGWTPERFRAVMLLEACTFAPYNLRASTAKVPVLAVLAAARAPGLQPAAPDARRLGATLWVRKPLLRGCREGSLWLAPLRFLPKAADAPPLDCPGVPSRWCRPTCAHSLPRPLARLARSFSLVSRSCDRDEWPCFAGTCTPLYHSACCILVYISVFARASLAWCVLYLLSM